MSLASLSIRNRFFCAINKLGFDCVFLTTFNAIIWYCELVLRFWLITVDGQKKFESYKVLRFHQQISNCCILVLSFQEFEFKDLVFGFLSSILEDFLVLVLCKKAI